MSTPDKWIFFDLGWTLIDETAAHLSRYEALRSAYSRPDWPDPAEFLARCDTAASGFAKSPAREVLRDLGWSSSQFPEHETPYPHTHERLFPGVPALLQTLESEYQLGVIANQSAGTEDRLQAFGVRDSFSLVVASAEVGLAKPDLRIFSHALEVAGCRPEDATMVGDRLDNDIGPAKSAGWRTVRVLQGFSRLQVPRRVVERPDCSIERISLLTDCLDARATPE